MFEAECKAMRRSYPQGMPMIAVYAETKTKAYTLTHTLDQPHFVVQYDRPSDVRGSTLVGAVLVDPPEGQILVPVGLEQALTNTAQLMGVEWTSLIKVYRRGQEQVGVQLYDATEWWCKTCSYKRSVYPCWKCGPDAPGYRPIAGLGQQELPDVNRIREIAKSCGYAIGEHGSKERDLDLIATPWVEDAVDAATLIATLAKTLETPNGLTRVIGPETKPSGREAYTLHLNGWYKAIDISVTPKLADPEKHTADAVRQSAWWLKELHAYAYKGGDSTLDTKRAVGIAHRMLENSWGFIPAEQVTAIWESLGGAAAFYKTFGYQQFAEALADAFTNTNRIRLTPMEFEDGHRGWYFDNGEVYIDVELQNGVYSAYFRERETLREAYVEQVNSVDTNGGSNENKLPGKIDD